MAENNITPMQLEKRRKAVEATSTVGLIFLAVGLVAPFVSLENGVVTSVFKWIFTAGALIYTVARMVNVSDPDESRRLRRLRRMEMWAGFAFCIAAFFWFYNSWKLGIPMLTLGVLNDTVTFTLVGAVIQIVASWMISSQMRKDRGQAAEKGNTKEKKGSKGKKN